MSTRAPMTRMVRSELSLALGRPRTAITLATLVVIPVLATWGLHAIGGDAGVALGVALVSANEFTALALAVPVVLVAADAFAAERAHGTLDVLRLAPVGLARLVALKAAAVLVMALLTALSVMVAALLGGMAVLPLGPYSAGSTIGRALLVALWLAGQLAGFGVLLLPLSMSIRRTSGLVAAGLVPMGLGIVASRPDLLPAWIASVTPNGNWTSAVAALSRSPVDWAAVGGTTLRAALFALVGAAATAWLLDRRDS